MEATIPSTIGASVQSGIVFLVVAASLLFLGGRSWRSWRASRPSAAGTGCASGCGCGDHGAAAPKSWDNTGV